MLFKNHAENERELARLVAQETVEDLYGGTVRTYNGPGLLVGMAFTLFLVLVLVAGLFWLAGQAQAQAGHTVWLPLVQGAPRQFVLDCLDAAGQFIACEALP